LGNRGKDRWQSEFLEDIRYASAGINEPVIEY
jgi:hypothetical protein